MERMTRQYDDDAEETPAQVWMQMQAQQAQMARNFVAPAAPLARREPTEMSSMAGAQPLAELTNTPGAHQVVFKASYTDRADGFVRSTLPLWWAVSGASAALVLVLWVVGPLTGKWGFLLGWWVTSELLVIALSSVAVWAVMWWKWHRDSPDAIASRAADTRLRMAERWFDAELNRVYGRDDK
jgi:hypothetical protein